MTIRFKCPSCQKPLGVKDHLAGKKATCPVCKKPLRIPTPKAKSQAAPAINPEDIEAMAAAAFADEPAQEKKAKSAKKSEPIVFNCEYCFEEVTMPGENAGQREPCPHCKRIIKIPEPEKNDQPRDWRDAEKGPSLARANQPEELEGAWGTAVSKSRVSAEALIEADAIPEEYEPLSWGTWIKRGAAAVVAVGLVVVVVVLLIQSRAAKQEKQKVDSVLAAIDPAKEKDPHWRGEIYRGLGEYYLKKKKANEALKQFKAARSQYGLQFSGDALIRDAILIKLALNQLQLPRASTEDDDVGWPVVQKEVMRSIERMSGIEAKRMLILEIRRQLRGARHEPFIESLMRPMASPQDASAGGILFAWWIGKSGTAASDEKAKKLQADIQANIKQIKDNSPADTLRLGFAQGFAYKGDFKTAEAFLKKEPDMLNKFRMAVTLADIAHHAKAAETKQLLDLAAKAYPKAAPALAKAVHVGGDNESLLWLPIQFYRLIAQTRSLDAANKWAKSFPQQTQERIQLEALYLKLEKSTEAAETKWAEDLANSKSLAGALALEAITRHNMRHNHHSTVEDLLQNLPDPRYRPFVLVGKLVGGT